MVSSILIVSMIGLELAVSSNYTSAIWNYEDESGWPGHFCKEGGIRQSPIDIKSSDVIKDFKQRFIKNGVLKFIGYDQALLMGINNGHTIQFSSEGDATMHPHLSGGPLSHKYRLEQLHFHWLSEHAVDGRKFPMEIHFVHVRSDLNVLHALNEKDGLAIISVFCNVQAELDEKQMEKIEDLMRYVPRLLNTGDRISGVLLDLRKLVTLDTENYYSYAGSLTSPECNEVVIWIIMAQPIDISDAQYRLFGKVGIGRHNFRSLQPLARHAVFSPPPTNMWSTPYLVNVIKNMYKAVSDFMRNVTRYIDTYATKLSCFFYSQIDHEVKKKKPPPPVENGSNPPDETDKKPLTPTHTTTPEPTEDQPDGQDEDAGDPTTTEPQP